MSDGMQFVDLDDDPEKVYIFLDPGYTEEVVEELGDALGRIFDDAGILLLNGQVDDANGTLVNEIDREEVDDLLTYHDVMSGVNIDG